MEKVKIALIGAGGIANAHLASYAKVENADIYAICDINEERLNETADRFGITRRYTDVDTMLAELPELPAGKCEIAYKNEVKEGAATVWCTLDDNVCRPYTVELSQKSWLKVEQMYWQLIIMKNM